MVNTQRRFTKLLALAARPGTVAEGRTARALAGKIARRCPVLVSAEIASATSAHSLFAALDAIWAPNTLHPVNSGTFQITHYALASHSADTLYALDTLVREARAAEYVAAPARDSRSLSDLKRLNLFAYTLELAQKL